MISVILANYNGAETLNETLDSIAAQSFQDYEIVLVDDGSTDKSRKILQKFEKRSRRPCRLVIHERNKGQAEGFNTGVENSSRDIVCFIDSDDIWLRDKLSHVLRAFRDAPETAIFQHHMVEYTGGRLTANLVKPALMCGDLKTYAAQTRRLPWFVPTTGLAISRYALRRMGRIPWTFRVCADGFLTRSTMCFGEVTASTEVLGGYRVHEDNSVYKNDAFDTKSYINDLLIPELNAFYRAREIPIEYLAERAPIKPPEEVFFKPAMEEG